MTNRLALAIGLVSLLGGTAPPAVVAQSPERKIAEMELLLLGVSATVEPANPVIPKNTDAGVRIVVRSGGRELSLSEADAYFGAGFWVEGELAGFSLEQTQTLSSKGTEGALSADPLLLPIPAFRASGDYELNNLRVMAGGHPVLEVQPQHVPVKVIEQVLVTSVKTRPLTLDEIRAKGIVLDSDDYYAFEFTLGLKLESKAVNITFPVAFDRQGVPVPQFILPPPAPARQADLPPLPTIVPVLFEVDQGPEGPPGPGPRLPPLPSGGGEIRIPSVIIIPGNVGYLKQFFSAKLFVANGAPVGSGLDVRDITGKITLPPGEDLAPGTGDDPLALPKLLRDGQTITQPETLPVRAVGPDGEPGTADDVESLAPGEQAEAEFLVRGEREGFHTIDFDIRASLEGLVTGPVRIKGKAQGALLVRNPYFDVTFTVPGVIRAGETFKIFVTLTNLSEVAANSVSVTLPEGVASGAQFVGTLPPVFPTIAAREAKVFELLFRAQRSGQVVASYLRFEPEDGQVRPVGKLQLAVGIGERGVPLSPDTLVLPAAVDLLPDDVVAAAMRVLGQAWSVANAPSGTLPRDVVRTSRTVVTQKALALAEAGLRTSLGQKPIDALRDVAFDFWGGQPLDPGFDQLLRTTEAGRELRQAIGVALAEQPELTSPLGLEAALADVAASGPDFASFAVTGGEASSPLGITLLDASGRRTSTLGSGPGEPPSEVPGAALLRLGPEANAPVLGLVAAATGAPYTLDLRSSVDTIVDLSITLPKGDGSFVRGEFGGVVFLPGSLAHVRLDPLRPGEIVLELEGESLTRGGATVQPQGPRLVSATVIGPETLQGASPFGFQLVALFDRVVDAMSAARKANYQVPKNAAQGAKRQLSGRLVFVSLEQPEGPYIPTTFRVLGGVTDPRGTEGPSELVDVGSRLEDPGAIVSGRVFQADGTPVGSGTVTYVNNADLSCYRPNETGFAALPLDAQGHYEFRYVRQDNCGTPFKIVTVDPASGGRRQASAFVRAAGEAITLDLALFGRGAVAGTVRGVSGNAVAGASVVAYSQTDPQIGGAATSDGLGHYFIDGITVGAIVVKAGKGAALGSKAGRIDRARTTASVDIVLDGEAARVFGTVYKVEDAKQSVVPGVYAYFKHFSAEHPFGQTLGATSTGADGSFAFDGVPVGQFEVSAAINTRDRDAKQGVAVAGTPVSKDLLIVIPQPAELATVSGQVFMPDGVTAASNVVVSVGNRGVVSADGAFTIGGVTVSGGAQSVTARSRDGRRSASTTVVANQPKLYDGLKLVLSGLGNAAFRVLDEKGQPVKGQQVGLLGQCGNPCGCAAATTDQDGIAVFDNLSYGRILAKAIRSTASFTDVASGSLSIVADDTTVLTSMRFTGAGSVAGTVRDPADSPVQGADVLLYSQRFVYDGASSCGLQYGYAGRARTGLDGRYSFTGVNLGQVSVSATQDFFGKAAVGNKGVLSAPGQPLVLDMKFADTTAGVLSGSVFLPGGGLAGAGIEVAVEGPLPEIKVSTDADGHYEFAEILPEGYYTLTARDPVGGGLARVNVTLKRQQDLARDVQLKGRGTVRVQVVSGVDLVPLESALVKLTETAFPSRSFDQSVRPGNQGTVLFLDVYEGPLKIEVSDPFARSGSATAVLPGPNEEIEVQVKVTPTGRVTGRFLMPDQTPVPYGTVTLKAGGKVVGQTTALGSGDVGRFAFDFVPVGPVTLDAQDPATARVGFKSGTLDHEGDPPLELDVIAQGLGRVYGTVMRGGASQPLARVAISSGSYHSTTLTDDRGRYDVDGVPEGRVTVTASLNDQGFLAGSNSAALEGDGESVEIDVTLREAGSVAGQIVPASEEDRVAGRFPPSVVKLYVGGTGGGSQETSTRPDGSFSFDVVPTGRVSFTADVVDSIDRGSATLDVVPGENTVQIPLNGVGLLKGQGVESEEPSAPGVDGWISFSGPAFPGGASVRLGNDGRFEIPEVLAGDFTARLQHGQGALALYGSASGNVAPGQETEIKVALQPSGEIRGSVFRPAAIPEGKRAAFGAEVKIVLAKGGEIPLLAQEDGGFSVKGVPQGDFLVRVFDPVGNGRAVVGNLHLTGDLTVVPEILLDESAPLVSFVQPVPGSTKSALGGLLVLEVSPETAGDVDPASVSVTYPKHGTQGGATFAWDPATRRFTGSLVDQWLEIGSNTLVASVKDLSGNVGQAEVGWTVTGGTVRGRVLGGDDQPRAGATVRLGSLETTSEAPDGTYAFFGLRPGQHSAKAIDPDTGLESPSKSGTLVDGELLVLPDLRLPAAGLLAGSVLHKGGAPADGVTVTWSNRSDVTEQGGQFDLGLVPVGTYSLAASAPDGDVGAGSATVAEGAPANATITLNGVGQVEVTVKNASLALAANASVSVSSSAPFPRSHTGKKTGPAGEPVTYDKVLSGTITVTASLTGLGGETTGFLEHGQLLKLTVALEPAGRISGIVSRGEGGPAGSVSVHLTGPKNVTTTTDPQTGEYAFENVPFGHFYLNASTGEGDFGSAEGDLSGAAPDATAPITLNGLGTVSVHVTDADGVDVAGAHVSVSSLGRSSSADADGTGRATLANVRAAASVHATATHPTTGAKGDKDEGPLAAAGSLTIEVALERLGSVSGTVFGPDGVTAVDGVQVQLSGPPVITHDGGQFSFTNLKLGTHTLSAYVDGRLRARETVVLDGPQATKNLVLVGVGSVVGTVTRSGGAAADGAKVHLQSHAPVYGGPFDTVAASDGGYEIHGVPIGAFTVSATLGADARQEDDTLTSNDDQVTVNLELLDSAITLPRTFTDGNDLDWTLSPDGSLRRGVTFPNAGGTPRLTVVRDGTSATFTGPDCPTNVKCAPTEENSREVVLRQADLLGLEATRKLFFPADGYFIRVLDLLYNPPTASPVTISVRREAQVGGATLVGEASADGAVGSDDDWVALDDDLDDDIYRLGANLNFVIAPSALVLSGPGRAASSTLVASQPAANRTLLAQTWDDVTIDPGQTVAFLSLFAAQADRVRAVASAERLVQLPPEALAGLSVEEAGEIVNFEVPPGLVSAVSPLPPNDGVVSGRVLASDGLTPPDAGSGTTVELRSRSPYHGRPLTNVPPASGVYSFKGAATPNSPRLVPRGAFDLAATASVGNAYHPFAVPPVAASAAFPTEGVIDLTNVEGRVLRVSSSSASSSRSPDKAVDDDLATSWRTASGDAANQGQSPFFEIGLPSDATVHEVRIRGTRDGDTVSIYAGRIELSDVSGAVLWSQDVALPLVGAARDGDFPVPAVAGVRNVRFTSTDDRSTSPGLAELRVLGEADLGPAKEAKQDLVFLGTGMLEVQVLRSDQTPVSGSRVRLTDGTHTSGLNTVVNPDASFIWRVLPPNTYAVTAQHPTQSPVISVGDIGVAANALTHQDLVFDTFGSVTGTVTTAKGGAISANVRLEAAGFVTRSKNSTAATGFFEFTDVPPGMYTLTVRDNRTGFEIGREVTVAAGPPTVENFMLRPVTAITVTATFGSLGGPQLGSGRVYAEEEPGQGFRSIANVSGGHAQITVTGPTVTVRVQTTGTQLPSVGEGQATFDEGDPVELPIVVPGLGTITGRLLARDGKVVVSACPSCSARVAVADPTDPSQDISAAVVSTGDFQLDSVPVRPLLLRSELVEGFAGFWSHSVAELPVALSAHAETLPQDALAAVGDLGHSGRIDAWEVLPSADAGMTLLLEGRAYADVAALPDPLLEVYSPDGTLVAANDDRNGSDKNSQLSFTATSGSYVILARGASGTTGGYRLATYVQNENHVFRPWSGRLFSGHVTRIGDGAPAPGQGLRLLRRGAVPVEDMVLITHLAADPQGEFSFPGLWSGSLALEAIDAEGIALARREFDIAPGEDPGPLDLVVPVHGTVTVHVMRGSEAVAGIEVEIESGRADVLPGDKTRRASTDASGSVSFSVPIGAVTARATDPARPASGPVEVPGTVEEAVAADLSIDFAVIRVDVEGFVRNTSGTPLPEATVELVGFGTSPPTGADGFYRFTNVPGARSWTIRASHPKASSPQSITLVLADQDVQQDFTLAVPILKGRVVEPDATGVAGGQVRVCESYYGTPCLASQVTADDGGFIFLGRPTWTSSARITVTLQDGSGLQTTVYNVPYNTYLSGTVMQNVTLPPSALVRGTVRDHEGAEVSGAQVTLFPEYTCCPRNAVTDGHGFYEFLHVQLYYSQPVRVYAESPAGDPGENRGTLAIGQQLELDVALLEQAELRIRLVDEIGGELGGPVSVQSLLAPGADAGIRNRSLDLVAGDAESGRVRVPLGPYRVIHDDPGYDPGAAEGELASGDSLPVTVQRGSHVRLPQTLGGDEGSYTTDEWCGDADCGPFAQTVVPPLREGFPPVVRLEAQGRALRSLQLAGVGLRVRRQQYVPPSGAFARTLTTLHNTTGAPTTVVLSSSLRVDFPYDLNGSFDATDAFGVAVDGSASLGLVVGSTLPPVRAEFRPPYDYGEGTDPGALETDHVITLEPGQNVAFMTYSLAATDGDLAALTAKASALVDLSYPDALAHLTAQERAAIVNFDVPPLGDVVGTVSSGGAGVAGAQVGLVDGAGQLAASTTTNESGDFTLDAVLSGSYSAAAFDPGSGRRGRVAVDVVAGEVRQAPIELLDDAALGSVRVHAVWERVGGPVPDVDLTLRAEGYGPVGEATLVTDPDGEALFTGIPAGAVSVRWPDSYRGQPGTVAAVAAQTVDLELVAPPPGNVSGHVRGAGGTVPVPYARVEALDVATDELLASGSTDEQGLYTLFDLRAGAAGFKVRAIWPADPAVQAERAGSFSQVDETIENFDLDLPIAVVTGHVYFDGGTEAVTYPTVFATPTGVVDPRTYYADQAGPDGAFTVLVGGLGDYVVTGQDNATGLGGQASAQVTDLAAGAVVPVVLQPSGSVTVAVSSASGPVSPAQVALSSLGLAFDRFGDVDGAGEVTFDRVALGAFRVQARDLSGTEIRGSATGELAGAGASATVPIELPATAALEGQVVGSLYEHADVWVWSLENDGPLGPPVLFTSGSPYYSVSVPVGPNRVGAFDFQQDPPPAGLAEGVVTLDGQATIDVTLGSAAALPASLTGSDAFAYDVQCDGTLSGGGGPGNDEAYWGAYYVALAGRSFSGWPCFPASAEQDGRQLGIGPRDVAGIQVSRKVYIPFSGGFARYLELLTNPGSAAVTVPVWVEGDLASDTGTHVVASPASTGRSYALTDSAECCRPVLGHVFAGPGGRVGVSTTQFDPGDGYFFYRWTVTIGPGETVALMHFAVQRGRQNEAGARQQAEALVNLTDPHALDGMTPQERSQVVNFDVP